MCYLNSKNALKTYIPSLLYQFCEKSTHFSITSLNEYMQVVFGDYTQVMANVLNLKIILLARKDIFYTEDIHSIFPEPQGPYQCFCILSPIHQKWCRFCISANWFSRDFETYFPPFQTAAGFSSFPVCFENQHAETWNLFELCNPSMWTLFLLLFYYKYIYYTNNILITFID